MLKDKAKKNELKKDQKNNSSQLGLICQTRDPGDEIDQKEKKSKQIMNYKVQLSTNLVLKDKIEKQMIKKDKKITRVNQN
jgi:predicted ferric reductase